MTINTHSSSTQHAKQLSHPKYRADIDGLRAIAILSVIAFHAFPNWVKGGFIGVDIFFVISGFLISTIILGSLARNSFSFIEFYSRRIKRIFPALLLVLISSAVLGCFVLFADEYKQLGSHIVGGAGFISNFLFWLENSYFSNAADTKPLLHLWSLGVEEQYYILWPLLLWMAWKIKINLLTIAIIILVISFGLNISEVHDNTTAAFYLPQSRFWELLEGSLLAYITLYQQNRLTGLKKTPFDRLLNLQVIQTNSNKLPNVQSILGATLIIIGILVINKDRDFPGWWAILPTLGTVLIILAGAQAWLNRVVLSNRVLVWFGLISFPLYLWHWPLLSFARILESETPPYEIRIAAILISIILAWLTYKFIEKPIQSGDQSNKKVFLLLILMTIVGVIGYIIFVDQGNLVHSSKDKEKSDFANYFELNAPPNWNYSQAVKMDTAYRNACNFYDFTKYLFVFKKKTPKSQIDPTCYTRNPAKKNVLLIWGDSHAQHLYSGLNQNLADDWQILTVASSGCRADANVTESSTSNYCQQSNWFAIKTIKETKPNVVIVAQNKGHQAEQLNQLGDFLLKSGVAKVIFVGPTPHWKSDLPKIILRKLWDNTPERTFVGVDEKVMNENAQLKTQLRQTKNLIFVDLIDFFCNESGCLTRLGNDKKTGITSFDYGHLPPLISDYLAKNLLVQKITDSN